MMNEMNPFAVSLLKWYDRRENPMPWRGSSNPYHIWLSEVMLQQTQVQTVIPYYQRWIARFPDVESVARANPDELMKLLEGLGYYSRVRNFMDACRTVMSDFQGSVPAHPKLFRQLKGVGPYICAAVQSIAFQHPLPAVDGNVNRIIGRVMKLDQPPDQCRDIVIRFLTDRIPSHRPGDFNQAMMDLGRTLCRAAKPDCGNCPVNAFCGAYVDNSVDKYPVKYKRKSKPHKNIVVGVIWKCEEILVAKRKPGGLLGGLWEFPGGKQEIHESLEECVVREVREELGIEILVGSEIGCIRHAYTHFTLDMTAFNCRFVGGRPQPIGCAEWRWLDRSQFDSLAFPKANHKLFPLIPIQNPF